MIALANVETALSNQKVVMTEIYSLMTDAILPAPLNRDIPVLEQLHLFVLLLAEMQLLPAMRHAMTETLQIVMDVVQHVVQNQVSHARDLLQFVLRFVETP